MNACSLRFSAATCTGVFVVGFLACSSAARGETEASVFGPVTYERRTSRPEVKVAQFSLPSSDGEVYLRVINGDEDGNHRASSSTVHVNGIQVVQNKDLNQQTGEIIRPLRELEVNNTLEVRLTSAPKSILTFEIFAVLQQIEVAPASFTLTSADSSRQLTIIGIFSDGAQRDLTVSSTGTTYVSSDPNVASVTEEGLVTAVANGGAVVTVTNGSFSATAEATVNLLATLTDIVVSPELVQFTHQAATQQLQVTGQYSDGSQQDLTSAASGTTYETSAPNVATVTAAGLVTAVANGQAAITITNNGFSVFCNVEVNLPVTLTTITVSPDSITFTEPSATQQLQVTGHYSDGSQQDLTLVAAGTTYQTSDPSVATVTPDGLVAPVDNGQAVITATNGGLSATCKVIVDLPPTLTGIVVSPESITFTGAGQSHQLQVTGQYSDSSTQDLTSASTGTTYQTSDAVVATVSPDGLVLPVDNGQATITVTNGGFTALCAVTVELPPVLTGITVSPDSATFTDVSQSQQLQVTGQYSDSSQQDLTAAASGTTYQSSDPSVATVTPDGLVEPAANGQAVITVSNGGFSDTCDLTVDIPPVLTGITVSPESVAFTDATESQQLQVTGQYSDGSEQDLTLATTGTTYQTSNPSVATVTPDGLVAPVTNGQATITATNDGLSAACEVTVDIPPVLTGITVSPESVELRACDKISVAT